MADSLPCAVRCLGAAARSGEEDLGNKITSGAYAGFGEYVPQLPLYGVHGDHQMVSDVEGREALQHESGQLLLSFGQAVGRHQ